MRSKKAYFRAVHILVVTATLLSLFALGFLVLKVWPTDLLSFTGEESSSLSVVERLNAETAMRNSILSGLAGLFAAGVAFAALRQASLAHRAHEHQRHIDWSKAYAEASKMLSDPNPTNRIAGVIGLRNMTAPQDREATVKLVNLTLAAFIRNASGQDSDAIHLALQFLCESRGQATYSISGARLTNLSLADISFKGVTLDGVSFRGSTLRASEKGLISAFEGVDLGEVTWKSN